MYSIRSIATFAIVTALVVVMLAVAANLMVVPEHDEFAYVTNGLNWSGQSFANGSITWQERPPLFWWTLTALFSFGLNPTVALILSPIFTVLLALLIARFASELTGDWKTGLFAGLITGASAYYATISVRILTDTPGTFFAALSFFAFYEYFFKEKRFYAPIFGAALAFALIMRDESLIMIPLFAILWILFASNANRTRKAAYLGALVLVLGGPVAAFGLVNTMQGVSNALTGVVLGGWPYIVAILALITYFAYKAHSVFFTDAGAAFLVFFTLMLPFFYDNYLLGNVEYLIEGKGILARPVSHLIMLPETAGVGSNLSTLARALAWSQAVPSLLSVMMLILVCAGLYYLYRQKRRDFLLIGLWAGVTLAYVVAGTQLEDRFLMIAFPPLAILSGIGVSAFWRVEKVIATGILAISLVLENIVPRTPFSYSDLLVVVGTTTTTRNWLLVYLPTITLSPPHPQLSPIYMAEALIALGFGIGVVVYAALGTAAKPEPVPLQPIAQQPQEQSESETKPASEPELQDSDVIFVPEEASP